MGNHTCKVYVACDNNGLDRFFGVLGNADGISHVTHISGMVIGYFLLKKEMEMERRLICNS